MLVTNKALFVIERNLHRDLTLHQIARYCDVSRFHLAHAFGESTGLSVMEYLRGRRLTEAAYALASGADDILSVALDSRYASHEAFSRAFKAQFGKTPEEVRNCESIEGLKLVDAIRHLESKAMTLKEPRIQKEGELLFVGLSEHVPYKEMQNIAGQWERFMSGAYGEIDHKIAEPPVGIATGSNDDGIEYVCAAGVTKFGLLPKNCVKLTLPPATYAVFAHDGHVTQIRETYEAIWNDWFPKSGRTPDETPSFERHNDTFDPRTGSGGVTIWIPIRT
ncbi:MAG: AraC family transcriptional regulator [Bradyrhizobiaceae bacterium]|nr:AraC family transcriptional regulator [Bradyrhizobiaceae bacterium]